MIGVGAGGAVERLDESDRGGLGRWRRTPLSCCNEARDDCILGSGDNIVATMLRFLVHRSWRVDGGIGSIRRCTVSPSKAGGTVSMSPPLHVISDSEGSAGEQTPKEDESAGHIQLAENRKVTAPVRRNARGKIVLPDRFPQWKKLPKRELRTEEDKVELQRRKKYFRRRKKALDKLRIAHLPYDLNEEYSIQDAIGYMLKNPSPRFDQTFRAFFHLRIDARKANEHVRGSGVLPHGPVRTMNLGVFARSPGKEEALAAGATIAGEEELIDQIAETKKIPFSRAIATPEMMPLMSKIARILGPKGLMPNPKHGTVAVDVGGAVREWLTGKIFFKNDRAGNVEITFGKASLGQEKLLENIAAACMAIYECKPEVIKKTYVERVQVAADLEKAITVSKSSLNHLMADLEAQEKDFMINGVLKSSSKQPRKK